MTTSPADSGEPTDYTATLPRKRMGAGVLFTDEAGLVLLVEPTYKDYWEIPGGAVEADESPYAAACREVREELGLNRPPGRLLVLDWVPPSPGRTEGLMTVFDGGNLSQADLASIRVPPAELRGWALCTEQQQRERLSPLLARRAAAALQARKTATVACLEHGYPTV
jgi:8-oxo-dGTP pyrophosphatase MutT (NUDIX family)